MTTPQDARSTPFKAMFHSLRFKVSFFVALVMVIVLLVLSGVLVLSQQRRGSQEILQNGLTFANFSAGAIYDNYTQYYTHPQPKAFEDFTSRVKGILDVNHDVKHVSLLGINGRILFDSDEFTTGKYTSITPRVIEDAPTIEQLGLEQTSHRDIEGPNGQRVTEIMVPLNESGIGHVLSVRYLISYDSLAQRTNAVLLQMASVAVPLMVLVIIVAILFAITLTRPITKLTKAAAEIRAGNFDVHTDVASKDEIGTLALTLNEMTAQLRQTYDKLNKSLWEITQRTGQLSEEKARFFASIDSLPLGFMMTDATNRVLISNPSMQAMLGGKGQDIATDSEIAKTLLAKAADSLKHKDAIHLPELNHNGRVYRAFLSPILLSNTPLAAAIGTAILLEDITEERVLARSKDEFFSIASHELRTPLTAIRGNSGMILDYFSDAIKGDEPKDMIHDIHKASVRLIGIVNDFLDVSRLEQGKMAFKLEPVSLTTVAADVIKEVATIARDKHIALNLDSSMSDLPVVWADQNKTKQVLFNLVGNALKFVERGSVKVTATADKKFVKIIVADTGKGIPAKNQALLFHKFQQAASSILTRDNTQSTGLGLYISKLIIENMGGQIKLEYSTPQKGTAFSFTLPIATDKQKAQAPAEAS